MSLSPSAAALTRFFRACDAFCRATDWPLVRLSRALFTDDGRIAELRSTKSDVGIKRLARAETDLSRLAADAGVTLPETLDSPESDRESRRPRAKAGGR